MAIQIDSLETDPERLATAIHIADVNACSLRVCGEYVTLFGRLAESAEGGLKETFQLLAMICGWRLRPDNGQDVFESLAHEMNWKAVSEDQLNALATVAVDVQDPELRARLCDLVWSRLRSHEHARLASQDYVTSADLLTRQAYLLGERERLSRAVQLAGQLGRSQELFTSVCSRIVAIAQIPDLLNCSLADCLGVLLEARHLDPKIPYDIAIARAQRLKVEGTELLWSRKFWELAAGFASLLKDDPAHRAAIVEVACTFEREAERAPLQAIAAQFWEMALHTYRRISDTDDDRLRVHKKLLDAQKHIPGEMSSVDVGPFDLSDPAAQARDRVRGKDKWHALAELVIATRWLAKSYCEEEARKTFASFPSKSLFASMQFGSTGKVAATAPSASVPGEDPNAERLRAEMCQQYRFFVAVTASGTIEPMRLDILHAHNITLDDVSEFLKYSPLIPPGRVTFFTIGILAGLQGRFIEALHVLVPQLEHLLRCSLADKDVITSSLNDAGLQQEYDLNRLLVMKETEELLGEDLCFTLRMLFTERYGYNLRNEISHGMLTPGAFFSESAVYAWWLFLRIVGGPIANAIWRSEEGTGEESGETAGSDQ